MEWKEGNRMMGKMKERPQENIKISTGKVEIEKEGKRGNKRENCGMNDKRLMKERKTNI